MMSRDSVLALSIAIALAFHGGLLALAPRLAIMRSHAERQDVVESFRVRLRDIEVPPETPEEPEAPVNELTTRPGKIEDLLKWEDETLEPAETLIAKSVEVPRLAERLVSEVLERRHDLEPDTADLARVDAKIIEIAEETARRDIEIPRRLVSPSPMRVLSQDEFPVLRTHDDFDDQPILSIPPARSLLAEPVHPPGQRTPEQETGDEQKPPYEEHVLAPEPSGPAGRELTEEKVEAVALAPVIEEVRKENPRDFIDDLVDIKLDAYFPPDEKEGFFRLRILPKEGEDIRVLPKDVTFVIDASNSIVQHKLDGTVQGAREVIAKLRPEDTFNVVIFRDTATMFQPEPVPAIEENKQAALGFLAGLESRGQTDVYNAMRPVIEMSPRSGTPGIVFLMTDGRPTTGLRDARSIINALTAENERGNTIYAFGGGNTVNRYLLDLIAYRNKGESFVSAAIPDIPEDLPKFFDKVSEPILVNLRADYGRIKEENVFPKEVPDFYKGRAVTVYGRFDPDSDNEFAMRLTGKAQADSKELIFRADLRQAASGESDIARNWAFERIYYLIGEVCRVGEKPELLAEIRELSRKYNIRTSYDE